jgi:hypothetical protein
MTSARRRSARSPHGLGTGVTTQTAELSRLGRVQPRTRVSTSASPHTSPLRRPKDQGTTGDEAAALSDLEALLRSNRNFDGIEARARALLADVADDGAKPTEHGAATSRKL